MATPIKNLIQPFLHAKQKEHKKRVAIEEALIDTLDSETKKHSCLARIENNTAYFYADSSMWAYQLTLVHNQLLKILQTQDPTIQKITIKVRNV